MRAIRHSECATTSLSKRELVKLRPYTTNPNYGGDPKWASPMPNDWPAQCCRRLGSSRPTRRRTLSGGHNHRQAREMLSRQWSVGASNVTSRNTQRYIGRTQRTRVTTQMHNRCRSEPVSAGSVWSSSPLSSTFRHLSVLTRTLRSQRIAYASQDSAGAARMTRSNM